MSTASVCKSSRVQVESNTVTTMDIGQSEALFRSSVSVSRRTKPVKAVPDLDWQSVRPAATGCDTKGTASSKATSASRPLTYFLHPKRSTPGSQPAALSPGGNLPEHETDHSVCAAVISAPTLFSFCTSTVSLIRELTCLRDYSIGFWTIDLHRFPLRVTGLLFVLLCFLI